MPYSFAVAGLTIVVPAVYVWWMGRSLVQRANDPALAELLLAHRQRVARAAAAGVAVLIVWGQWGALWAIPLMGAALAMADYPLRRALHGETWELGGYLWYVLRAFAGGVGFWILLMLAPLIVVRSAPHQWIAAGLVAIALLGWYAAFRVIWLWTHDATPLSRADLDTRFAEIVRRAGVQAPGVYRFGGRGGRVMNAVALPAVRRSTVAIGDGLLETLGADEIVAVFAHEVAHLEHYSGRRIRRLRLLSLSLIALAGLVAALAATLFQSGAGWVQIVWPVAVLIGLGRRAARNQKHETESDLRAVALCGDTEALVRGLTVIHMHARIPRRWATEAERVASHPSLARRIQAIRMAASVVATDGAESSTLPRAGLAAPVLLRSTTGGTYVLLDDTRAHWFEGVPADSPVDAPSLRERAASYRAVAYTELSELRVATSGGADRTLRATDRAGQTWSTPLEPADVGAAQAALDVVDTRLGARGAGETSWLPAKLAAALVLFAAMAAGALGVILVPVALALHRPSVASLVALGVMSVARAAIAVTTADAGAGMWATVVGETQQRLALLALAMLGVATLWLAWRRRRSTPSPGTTRLTFGVLGGTAAVLAAMLALEVSRVGIDWVAAQPVALAFSVALVGLGGALLTLPRRATRASGAIASLAASVLAALAVTGRTPWGGEGAPRIAWSDAHAVTVVARESLGVAATQLRLSPGATLFAAARGRSDASEDEEDFEGDPADGPAGPNRRFTVARFGGGRRTIDAADVAFADDRRVMVLSTRGRDSLELRLESADVEEAAVWRVVLPGLLRGQLAVDPEGRWTVFGYALPDYQLVTISGRTRDGAFETTRWAAGAVPVGGDPVVFGNGATVIASEFDRSTAPTLPIPVLGAMRLRWALWRVNAAGRRRIGTVPGVPSCRVQAGGDSALCVVREGTRTSVWRVSEAGTVTAVASMRSAYGPASVDASGWVAVVPQMGGPLVVLDAPGARAVRARLPRDIAYPVDVRAAPHSVGVLGATRAGPVVTLIRIQ